MTYRFKSCRGHSKWRKDLRRMAVSPFSLANAIGGKVGEPGTNTPLG